MPGSVLLTEDAARDLEELYAYIAEHDTPEKSDYMLDQLEKVFGSLAQFPRRGAYPKELMALGIKEYREVFFKPCRVIYRLIGDVVYVYLIADGRRDMRTLLQRRLLDA